VTREIEMKFPVGDLSALRKAVLRAGGEYAGTALQTDCYFDTPEMGLMRQDRGLRLRTSRPVGRASPPGPLLGLPRRAMPALHGEAGSWAYAVLTYKGPRAAGGRAKSRREIETTVADPRAVEEMLKELGLAPCLVIQKRRSTYRLGGCLVELDELPLLGEFVEIEGAGVRAIESVARRIGLKGEPTKAGYAQLAVAACPRAGKGCREITFRRYGRRCEKTGTKGRK
jgi:adenylate cyclase, class 2